VAFNDQVFPLVKFVSLLLVGHTPSPRHTFSLLMNLALAVEGADIDEVAGNTSVSRIPLSLPYVPWRETIKLPLVSC